MLRMPRHSSKLGSHLDDNDTLVEPKSNIVRVLAQGDTPRPLQCIAQRVFYPVSTAIPHLDGPVLTTTDDDGEIGVKDGEGNVVRVTLHGLHATLAEVVPDLDGLVVTSGNEIGLVGPWVKVDGIDALFVRIHGEISGGRSDAPHLDATIEAGGSKGI